MLVQKNLILILDLASFDQPVFEYSIISFLSQIRRLLAHSLFFLQKQKNFIHKIILFTNASSPPLCPTPTKAHKASTRDPNICIS